MAITHYYLPDGTSFPHVVNSNQPEPDPEPKPPIEQDQPEFSLSDLEPFEPEPFVEVPLEPTKEICTTTTERTLQEIVMEEQCFNFIKAKTLEVLENPPGGHDELWDLLRELVSSEEFYDTNKNTS